MKYTVQLGHTNLIASACCRGPTDSEVGKTILKIKHNTCTALLWEKKFIKFWSGIAPLKVKIGDLNIEQNSIKLL